MSSPWYKDGLRFSCTQCGNCCTGSEGYVWLNQGEIHAIAGFLGRRDGTLTRKHVRKVGIRFSLTEDPNTGDCCFLKTTPQGRRICGIYPVRPLQCRTWPFWETNLASSEMWNAAAGECPGMNRGRRHDLVQIEIHRTAKRTEDLPA